MQGAELADASNGCGQDIVERLKEAAIYGIRRSAGAIGRIQARRFALEFPGRDS